MAIVGCKQNELRVLTKTFHKVEDLVDDEGNVLIDQNDNPEVKVPNPRLNFPTYTRWHGMLCIVHP